MNTVGKYYYGEYNRHSYSVFDHRGNEIYTAGNCHFDSQVHLDPDEKGAVNLRGMRAMCLRTTKDIAEENKAVFHHIQRVDEPESE